MHGVSESWFSHLQISEFGIETLWVALFVPNHMITHYPKRSVCIKLQTFWFHGRVTASHTELCGTRLKKGWAGGTGCSPEAWISPSFLSTGKRLVMWLRPVLWGSPRKPWGGWSWEQKFQNVHLPKCPQCPSTMHVPATLIELLRSHAAVILIKSDLSFKLQSWNHINTFFLLLLIIPRNSLKLCIHYLLRAWHSLSPSRLHIWLYQCLESPLFLWTFCLFRCPLKKLPGASCSCSESGPLSSGLLCLPAIRTALNPCPQFQGVSVFWLLWLPGDILWTQS